MKYRLSVYSPGLIKILGVIIIILSGITYGESSDSRATCAVVYDYGWDSSINWLSNPHKGYCEQKDIGTLCDLHTINTVTCSESDDGDIPWYQAAIDYAANKNSDGNTADAEGRTYPAVAFTRGIIKIKTALEGAWPIGRIGIHLQSGVNLFGSPSQYGTTLVKLDDNWIVDNNGTKKDKTLEAMIVSSHSRTGNDILKEDPAKGVWIDSIAISGSADSSSSLPACSAFNDQNSYVKTGILVLNAAPDHFGLSPTIVRNSVSQVSGNAIDLGFYTGFVDSGISTCSDNALCKLGTVLKVTGEGPQKPAQVMENTICGVGFGGITVIGENVEISGNKILQVKKTWENLLDKQVGSTMGVSAGFVGSSNISVHHNVIEGGDYSIGSDGSFPVFIDYQDHWGEIVETYEYFSDDDHYPSGPYNSEGESLLSPEDAILANQVILDLASKYAASFDDRTGFNTYQEIHNNFSTNSIVGISLFRSDWSKVYGNTINETSAFHLSGVLLDSTINTFVYSNVIRWWHNAVEVRGLPKELAEQTDPVGAYVSKWGSSYNGIGIKPPSSDNEQWSYPSNHYEGNEVNVNIHDAGFGNNSY